MDQNIIQFVKQDYKKLLFRAASKDQPIEKTLKEFNMKKLGFALSRVECAFRHQLFIVLEKLWPDIITTPSNDPQISVTSEVIEQVATETQISPGRFGSLVPWNG
ncbi:hypothetical protein JTB14_012195 [Gonioctena quinquepunctata]|nr:hypothetical protein JTB14_012195 [Gonioctena quinquepunctata]